MIKQIGDNVNQDIEPSPVLFVSGGVEFDFMEGSGSYTTPSLGAGYKIGWDIDLK